MKFRSKLNFNTNIPSSKMGYGFPLSVPAGALVEVADELYAEHYQDALKQLGKNEAIELVKAPIKTDEQKKKEHAKAIADAKALLAAEPK